jgi:hypothetical protein
MSSKPSDLISLKSAATMSDKSVSTIRYWIRKKKITGYKEDIKNKNSPLLVSNEEIRTYLAINGKITSKDIGRPSPHSVSLLAKDEEIKGLLNQIEYLNIVINNTKLMDVKHEQLVDNLQNTIKAREYQVVQLNNQIEQMLKLLTNLQGSVDQLTTDNKRLISYLSLSWWQRATTRLMLVDSNDK